MAQKPKYLDNQRLYSQNQSSKAFQPPSPMPFEDRWGAKSIDITWDKKRLRAVLSALMGTIVEHYDYALYTYMGVSLTQHFFPDADPAVSQLKYFLVFAMGFLTKPIGAYIFGKIGDTQGRKYALRWSIMGIAIPTFLIGCLPSYQNFGWKATGLLVVLRMFQGMFISAERDGVAIFLYESMPKRWACVSNSLTCVSSNIGNGLAVIIGGGLAATQFMSRNPWAWRLPFLLAGVLGVATLVVRKYLIESRDYIHYKANKKSIGTHKSLFDILYNNKGLILLGVFISGTQGGAYYLYNAFWNNYLFKVLGLITQSQIATRGSIAIGLYIVLSPIFAIVGDRWKVIPLLRIGALACVSMLFLNMQALKQGVAPLWLMMGTGVAFVLFNTPISLIMIRLFKLEERYRCMSMSHAIGTMAISSTAPYMASQFYIWFQNPAAPLYYAMLLMVLNLVATCFIRFQTQSAIVQDKRIPMTPEQEAEFIESEPMLDINFDADNGPEDEDEDEDA